MMGIADLSKPLRSPQAEERPGRTSREDRAGGPVWISAPDPEPLAEQLADDITARLTQAVAERGAASLVVPGGSTPARLFDALSRRSAPWDKVSITLNDERWVEPTDPASNEALVRSRLLTHHAAAARFVGLKTRAAAASSALREVEARLKPITRPFDVMLLGMGADGHTASLFPDSPALKASLAGDGAVVQAVKAPGARGASERITLALPTILDSRLIAVLVTGADKLATLRHALGEGDPAALPIRAVLTGARGPIRIYWSA